MVLRCAALLVAIAGCSKVLGFKDVTVGDGGIDAGTLVAPPNTIVGRFYGTCHQPSGDVVSPTDISQLIIQALIFDESKNSYRAVEGAGKADGTFRIDDVPDGVTYILRLGTAYYVTDQHVIDHSLEVARRCVPTPVLQTTPTSIAWHLTGMSPFHSGLYTDEVEITSLALGYNSFVFSVLNAGDTVFDHVMDWTGGSLAFVSAPLLDAAAGDDLFISHIRREALPGASFGRTHSVARLMDMARPTGITIRDGVSTSITGAFEPVAPNKTISFTVDRAQFDAGHGGASTPFNVSARIVATPAPDDTRRGQVLVSFELNDISRNSALHQTVRNYGYGDPFPDSWKRYSVVEYGRIRHFRYPGASTLSATITLSHQVAEYNTTINASLPLAPPGGARIGGVDFEPGGKVAFDGTSPVDVTWNPVLSARSYQLTIWRAAPSSQRVVARITTTSTSIKVPAELFVGGQFYLFVLAAIRAPNDYQAGQILPSGLPNHSTELGSGLFRLSSDCGDGVIKPGEESCDTRGETAACDVDCTLPECGDGLRNAAAGETCDGGADASGCDRDCTLPACGDGIHNNTLEDCDDGNTIDDGNGCGTDCKLNNFCGNNRVEPLGEECDPGPGGETMTCDSDCTRVRCGDEQVNEAAGEECDDGEANGNGNCSTACKLQP